MAAMSLYRRVVPRLLLAWVCVLVAMPRLIDVPLGPWHHKTVRTSAVATERATTITIMAERGVRATLQIPSGPYFLSELLDITAALSNQSGRPLLLDGLLVALDGGSAPFFTLNVGSHSVPYMGPSTLASGQTATTHLLIALTASQRVRLVAQARFVRTIRHDGYTEITAAPDPLAGRWPAIALQVAPTVPADRQIAVRYSNHAMLVSAPVSARPHLLYQSTFACADEGTWGPGWSTPAGLTLTEPACPGSDVRWAVYVGAPRFAIGTALYCSSYARSSGLCAPWVTAPTSRPPS